MDWLVPAAIIALIVTGIFFLVGLLRTRVEFVDEGYKAVIYQFGRFHRIDGPGRVVLNKRVDKIQHKIDIRNLPRNHIVEALSYGVPFCYEVNFWRYVDLVTAAGASRERLVALAVVSDGERNEQINITLRDTLVQTIASMERDYPLPQGAELFQKILPILPGIPQCEEMLARWKLNLRRNLPKIGVYLDPDYPLVVKRVFLGEDITAPLALGRSNELLRKALPGIPEELLLQSLTTIAGYNPPQQISKFQLDSNQAARMELRPGQDGEVSTRIKIDAAPPSANQASMDAAPRQSTQDMASPRQGDMLTTADLAVLKRIPSYREPQSRTG
jgi:hypothetical protein